MPKVRKAEREPLTPEQVQALAQAIEGHSYAVAYHLMFTLGLRLGEALRCAEQTSTPILPRCISSKPQTTTRTR